MSRKTYFYLCFCQCILIVQSIDKSINFIFFNMRTQRKYQRPKLQLTISVPQLDNPTQSSQQQQEIYVKPMYSMKNSRKVPTKFNFDQEKLQMLESRRTKKLQIQKGILLNSLSILKGGAVSAIAQKQEQIDQLKSQLGWQQVMQLENEVQQLQQQHRQLLGEIKQLQERVQFQREGYKRLLEQKDKVIEELYVELQSMQLQIEKLQKFQEMKEKKIKIIQQQNNYLFCQLQQQKIAHIKHIYQTNEDHLSLSPQPQPQEQTSNRYTGQQINKQQVQSDNIVAKHQQELKQLTLFYEKRIVEMREIYEKELQLWPYSKESSLKNQLMEDVQSLKQTNIPAPKRLSNQITLQSDCYSMTKKALSKIDNRSNYPDDKNSVMDIKFFKKITNTPASQTTMSLKKVHMENLAFTNYKKQNETQINLDKMSCKQTNPKEAKSWKSFVVGALAGSACTLLINNILGITK